MSTHIRASLARSQRLAGRLLVDRLGHVSKNAVFWLTGGVLSASILLGGGTHSGFLSDAVLQLISVPLLWAAIAQLTDGRSIPHLKWPLAFVATVVVLPAAQLVPLPAALWTQLPGRDVISETYALLGKARPMLPLTMSPAATWLGGLALLPPLAVFLGSLALDYRQRRAISLVIVVMGVISVLIGLMQLAGGPNSALRFYEITNRTEAVGFFANRNHFAALLYSAMLFSVFWLADATIKIGLKPRRAADSSAVLLLAAAMIAFATLLVGQLMARSRAGLMLSIVSLFGGLAIGIGDRRTRLFGVNSAKFLICATAVTIVFSLQFTLYRILERFGLDLVADARIVIARNTITAANAYMPFGSGLGTFVQVYQLFEKPADIAVAYANHAHNDLLELWLEAGVPGLALIVVFLGWMARRTFAVWFGEDLNRIPDIDRGLMRAASIVIALLLAHSLVDYPLRTSAMMAVAAFAAALLIPSIEKSAGGNAAPRYRRRRQEKPEPLADERRAVHPREPWGQSVEWPEAWRRLDAPMRMVGDVEMQGDDVASR
jgi:O-antigen ligase